MTNRNNSCFIFLNIIHLKLPFRYQKVSLCRCLRWKFDEKSPLLKMIVIPKKLYSLLSFLSPITPINNVKAYWLGPILKHFLLRHTISNNKLERLLQTQSHGLVSHFRVQPEDALMLHSGVLVCSFGCKY